MAGNWKRNTLLPVGRHAAEEGCESRPGCGCQPTLLPGSRKWSVSGEDCLDVSKTPLIFLRLINNCRSISLSFI